MKKQSAGWPPLLVLAVMAVMAVPVLAGEVPVKNDSLVDGGSAAIQAGFVAHEQAAAWLTSPCNGHIVAVQIFWRSVLETTPPSLEDSITVYAAGTFPNPGAVLAFLDSPVLEDGYMNEFRYLDEQQTEPIYVPIQAGQTFIVSFKFCANAGPYRSQRVHRRSWVPGR